MLTSKSRLIIFSVCLMSCTAGCGSSDENLPDLGFVRGTVLLDGQPLSDATIMFEPSDSGALSSGMTNEAGEYELYYIPEVKGAALGTHTVRISKPDGDAGPELVAKKYNEMSELKKEVTEGENKINFELTSQRS